MKNDNILFKIEIVGGHTHLKNSMQFPRAGAKEMLTRNKFSLVETYYYIAILVTMMMLHVSLHVTQDFSCSHPGLFVFWSTGTSYRLASSVISSLQIQPTRLPTVGLLGRAQDA